MKEYPLLEIPKQTFGVEMKRVGHTEYKYVCIVSYEGVYTYRAEIPKLKLCKCFADAYLAAKCVDLTLARSGRYPVNGTLKKKV